MDRKVIEKLYQAYLEGVKTAPSFFPEVRDTLGILKREHQLGIISNNIVEFVHLPLKYQGLDSLFDAIIVSGGEGVGILKPYPEIFLRALNDSGLKLGKQ